MSRNWTVQQHSAIDAEGGSILVSAAAGSGKTAVLVERVIRRLTHTQSPTPADRILVATFTNAAAAEMKERIAARLTQLLRQDPGNSWLVRQKMLLETASIGTVHSFCLEVIRNNLHLLKLQPDFRIGDEKELGIMKEDIAAEILEEHYADPNKTFSDMVELFSTGRDDSRVMKAVFELYDFIRSHPFYLSWLDSKLALYDGGQAIEDTPWGKSILSHAVKTLQYAEFISRKALELITADEVLLEKYAPEFERTDRMLIAMEQTAKEGDWDSIHRAVHGAEFTKLPIVRGMKESFEKVQAAEYRSKIKSMVESLAEKDFCADSTEFAEDIALLRPITSMLFDITKEFDRRFREAKYRAKIIDFSDIEHFAIELLAEQSEDGKRTPTPLALELREHYRYVLVDEYQDTNEAQDLIFWAVSKGDNLFMVGDVKQSIYRFRQAMPEIFLAKKNSFPMYDGESFPAKIVLSNNFRSRFEVTDSVNMIFSMLMSSDVGELDYGSEEALVPMASYPDNPDCTTELHILEGESEEDLTSTEREAEYIAGRIEAMLSSDFQVSDSGERRAVRGGDIAILLRSVKSKSIVYLKALADRGIKGAAQDKSSFFTSREVSLAVSMLRVISNPLLDIPLAAVMLSPMFAFTPDDLAALRIVNRKAPLITNCMLMADEGDTGCKELVETIDKLRLMSVSLPVDKLIFRMLDITDLRGIARAMNNPEVRSANLRLLGEYGARYEKSGSMGLGRFIAFIDRLEQKGDDLPGAAAGAGEEDSVRIMSIHASKGLEFPVVFLADSSKKFNRQDLNSNILLHPTMGFAAMVRDYSARRQHTTIPMEAIKLELERSMMSEELRMLYVALTRAKEKLIVTTVQKRLQSKLSALSFPLDKAGRLPSNVVAQAGSYADWILMACMHHPDFISSSAGDGLEIEGLAGIHSRLSVVVSRPWEEQPPSDTIDMPATQQPDSSIVKRITDTISYVYPYEAAAHTVSKVAVSQLAKGDMMKEESFSKAPAFLEQRGLSGAQKGTAVHQFMLFADHSKGRQSIEAELKRLTTKRFLTPAQAESIDQSQMAAFYSSKLFGRMEQGQNLKREFRFMADADPAVLGDYSGEAGTDLITVQGVADLLFEEDGKLIIVDYKTDRVDSPAQLIERYKAQLEIYGAMLSHILGKEVGELLLYSFALGCEIPL